MEGSEAGCQKCSRRPWTCTTRARQDKEKERRLGRRGKS